MRDVPRPLLLYATVIIGDDFMFIQWHGLKKSTSLRKYNKSNTIKSTRHRYDSNKGACSTMPGTEQLECQFRVGSIH